MKTNLLEDALKLPVLERVELADEIYRSVDGEADAPPIAAELLAELERRDAEYEATPASACTVDELEAELFQRK